MYKLKSGYYITAASKYVKTEVKESPYNTEGLFIGIHRCQIPIIFDRLLNIQT